MDSIGLPPDTLTLATRLVLATLLGATVGLNREFSLKPAGLRTHALVALGAALLSYIGLQLGRPAGDGAAASRIIQGMVAGIGSSAAAYPASRRYPDGPRFDHRRIHLGYCWRGVAVGTGLWRAAVIAVALALIVLTMGRKIDHIVHQIHSDDPDDN